MLPIAPSGDPSRPYDPQAPDCRFLPATDPVQRSYNPSFIVRKHPSSYDTLRKLDLFVREKIYEHCIGTRGYKWRFHADLWPFRVQGYRKTTHSRAVYLVTQGVFDGSLFRVCRRIRAEALKVFHARLTVTLMRHTVLEPLEELARPFGLFRGLETLTMDIALDDLPLRALQISRKAGLFPHLVNFLITCSASLWLCTRWKRGGIPTIYGCGGAPPAATINDITYDQA